jgi:hypothetical protein
MSLLSYIVPLLFWFQGPLLLYCLFYLLLLNLYLGPGRVEMGSQPLNSPTARTKGDKNSQGRGRGRGSRPWKMPAVRKSRSSIFPTRTIP